ncbi:thioredoxin family protein [Tumebacillus flagellatus]|uniref:Thioredoxin n=1 Tax=Tumebacillus flagellatus TaxID=1157490 RepID=A0A074MH30_9BACL|nr:thioredoxin family protein [Tumebacillus flagellatus]KEO85022.1 hypothetical protein EL26_00195 [Tumebacillus flagellatus]
MKPTSESNLERQLRDGVSLVFFHASWCSPCQTMEEVLVEMQEEAGSSLQVLTLDIDEEGRLLQKFGIMSVPTLLLFQNGHEVERIIGLQSKKVLLEMIKPFLLE